MYDSLSCSNKLDKLDRIENEMCNMREEGVYRGSAREDLNIE